MGTAGKITEVHFPMSPSRSGQDQRKFLCELLRLFYAKGWVSGTGGGICGTFDGDKILVAPTGVHKEKVVPADLFVVNAKTGAVSQRPKKRALRLSECSPIFCEIIREQGAGSVMHSHSLPAVLAADLAVASDHVVFQQMEMLKGIKGGAYLDKHPVPVIENTRHEPDLLKQMREVLSRREYSRSYCILVRDHGAYIWGGDVWETKRHTEIYHFLFEAIVARSRAHARETH